MKSPPVLCVYADLGGAHAAVVQALVEGLADECPAEAVQAFRRFSPWLEWWSKRYGLLLRAAPWAYNRLYDVGSAPGVWDAIYRVVVRPPVLRGLRRLLASGRHACVVSACALTTRLVADVLEELGLLGRTRLVVLVVDLFDIHPMWAEPRADLTLACTDAAARSLAAHGVPSAAIRVVRFPVRRAFQDMSRGGTRRAAGRDGRRPQVLIMGGGDGVLDMAGIARRILRAGNGYDLCVVTGRNRSQWRKLRPLESAWNGRLRVVGYVDDVADLMRASDVLVTKGGPASIMEAIHVGLPIVLTGCVPRQESGNVRYVLERGLGVWMDDDDFDDFERHVPPWASLRASLASALETLPAGSAAREIRDLAGSGASRVCP